MQRVKSAVNIAPYIVTQTILALEFTSLLKHCLWQVRSQNAEKVTHIKGKLLDQAVILLICILFQIGNFS